MDFEQGFPNDHPEKTFKLLAEAIENHVVPFLGEWWNAKVPRPSQADVNKFRAAIKERAKRHPLPECYRMLPDLLERLAEDLRFNHHNYINIHPTPFIPAALSSFVVSLHNPNNVVPDVSHATTLMEDEAVAWLSENLLGIAPARYDAERNVIKDGAWGNVVSGGTVANMTAMLVARDYTYDKLSRPHPGRIGARGVIGQNPGIVLATAATHYSMEKALWFLGIGGENLIRVPVCWDEALEREGQKEKRFLKGIQAQPWKSLVRKSMQQDAATGRDELMRFYDGQQSPFALQPLESQLWKTIYSCFTFDVPLIAAVLTLGTTDTGTIEKFDDEVMESLKGEDIYLHADAAAGGFAFTNNELRKKANPLELFDSYTIDPHKLGYLHYPCGAIIFRDTGFRHQIQQEAPYLTHLAPTLEGSRPGGPSAGLWIATRTLEAKGYNELVKRLFSRATFLSRRIANDKKFQVLNRVDSYALAVAPLPLAGETRTQLNRLAASIHAKIDQPGVNFLVNFDTSLAGVKVRNAPGDKNDNSLTDIQCLRIILVNPFITDDDINGLADLLNQLLDDCRFGKAAAGAEAVARISGLSAPRSRYMTARVPSPRPRFSEEPE